MFAAWLTEEAQFKQEAPEMSSTSKRNKGDTISIKKTRTTCNTNANESRQHDARSCLCCGGEQGNQTESEGMQSPAMIISPDVRNEVEQIHRTTTSATRNSSHVVFPDGSGESEGQWMIYRRQRPVGLMLIRLFYQKTPQRSLICRVLKNSLSWEQ